MELLYILLVVLAVTRICAELAERVGQPSLVGEIFGGIALGLGITAFAPSLPILTEATENEGFVALTDLAIFFLMLIAGIELKPRKLVEAGGKSLAIAAGGFLLPLFAGMGLAWLFLPESELKLGQALFVGTALAITAIPVAVKILMDLDRLNSPIGNLIVSAALFDDVFSLILLAVLMAVINTGEAPSVEGLLAIGANVGIFFAVTIAIGAFVVPRVGRFIARARSPEFEISAILLYALGYAYFAELMGLHFIIGAFLAGLFFNRSTLDEDMFENVQGKLSGITSAFLAPIFFASIGMHLDLGALTAVPVFVGLLVLVAFGGKMLGSGLPARWMGVGGAGAAAIGVAMSARGAVELIIADIAMRGGLFSVPEPTPPIVANLFSAVVIVAVVTTLATPIALRRLLSGRDDDGSDNQ